jgi:DNA polymerase-3 subunit gamma/tau
MLSPAAFNALLKTLEEPPEHVKFIFATTEPQKVLPTILSRCQRFDLHRIPANLIAKHLQFIAGKEKITLEPAAAHAIARGAEGGLRDAESMLDQLVAFCGEKIRENDVLDVFGFTSEQTVVDLTGRILRRETPGAIDLLHQQSEAGKDMMRLMSDLIAYLRDLLVFKAKPDALKEDVEADVQTSLATHAELVTTDRLLELVDQFAAAEGRMKWAPNKKLHFEVAIIKAIQSLGQATLDEVIAKLGELRDGGGRTRSVAGIDDGGRTESSSPKVAASNSGSSASATRVAESPAKTNSDESRTAINAETLWKELTAKIPVQKAFLRNSAGAAHVLGIEGRNFQLGFPAGDKAKMDILGTQANRKLLETLLHEITGKDWSVKLSINDNLPPAQSTSQEHSRTEEFKDDPLIQEAIEMFNAQIKP